MNYYAFTTSKGVTYYLHSVQSGKGGSTLYYFSRERDEAKCCALPVGKVAIETSRGLPVLKKAVA